MARDPLPRGLARTLGDRIHGTKAVPRGLRFRSLPPPPSIPPPPRSAVAPTIARFLGELDGQPEHEDDDLDES